MPHSNAGNISLRDRLKLQFQEKEAGASQARLSSFKSTLTIALDFSTCKTASENLDANQRSPKRKSRTSPPVSQGKCKPFKSGCKQFSMPALKAVSS
ncbi:hypothetical protein K469DRAFT_702709 [Zopfia rhizophila CBS 207.26]|uniref:Uncharacterized protein n=1 Tax=Zopfia rhizophila CBS 207.26 TaxID=1314779 RepID=A0A6A6ECU2_9PEZI|nr:hypothetical protein K469DRAFT_702709 [Zopfia rhizophila CBS 207.26]